MSRWLATQGGEQPCVQTFGIDTRRLGEDDGELVTADTAGQVCRPHRSADAGGDLGEHRVSGEVPDAVVDGVVVVHVEHHQRETSLVPVRSGDLPRERVVERLPTPETRERVVVRELLRLSVAQGVVDGCSGCVRHGLEPGQRLTRNEGLASWE